MSRGVSCPSVGGALMVFPRRLATRPSTHNAAEHPHQRDSVCSGTSVQVRGGIGASGRITLRILGAGAHGHSGALPQWGALRNRSRLGCRGTGALKVFHADKNILTPPSLRDCSLGQRCAPGRARDGRARGRGFWPGRMRGAHRAHDRRAARSRKSRMML